MRYFYVNDLERTPSGYQDPKTGKCIPEKNILFMDKPAGSLGTVTSSEDEKTHDNVNHPSHYTNHPSGVECIQVTEHMNFCLGNAIKYIWRADLKNDRLEDLKKARWYLDREIEKLEKEC